MTNLGDPLTYGELRLLETLLVRYEMLVNAKSLGETVHRVLVEVSRRAGRYQQEPRRCVWCQRLHTDHHPLLCDECSHASRERVALEGRTS